MKEKQVVTNDNYKQIVLRRMIILCWILLAVCFVVKLFGGNFFNIVCREERFIKVCQFIESTFLYYVIAYVIYILGNYLIFKFIAPEIKFKSFKTLLMLVGFTLIWSIKLVLTIFNLPINPVIFTIVELILDILLLFAITNKFWKSVIGIVMMFGFNIITMVIRNLSFAERIPDNFIVGIIYMIDYYIMLSLSALYSYEIYLRRNDMGLFGNGWWLHKTQAELEAILPTLKDEDEIIACQKRIAKLAEKNEKDFK